LFDLWLRDLIPTDVLRVVLPDVWSSAEYPEAYVFRSMWVRWFRLADYPKPAEPLTIYRGATPRRVRRMAWTTTLLRASWFADRFGSGLELDPFIMAHGTSEEKAAEEARYAFARSQAGRVRKAYVYTATVEPAGILAVLDALGPDVDPDRLRNEEEIIIDPAYLPRRIRRAD